MKIAFTQILALIACALLTACGAGSCVGHNGCGDSATTSSTTSGVVSTLAGDSSVTAGGDAGTADEVFLFDVSPTGISHFFDASWNDIDFNPADTKVLKEGSATYLIHKTGAAYNWVAPAVVIAP